MTAAMSDLRSEFLERIIRRINERAVAQLSKAEAIPEAEFQGWLVGITSGALDGALGMEIRALNEASDD